MDPLGTPVVRPKPPVPSVVRSLHDIDGEMSKILEREDLSPNEKVTMYDQTLRRYLNRYDQYLGKTSVPSVTATATDVPTNDGDPILKSILDSVPKTMQTKSKLLLDRLANVITWNDRGEFGYKGSPVISGSNIIDLIGNAARPKSLKNVSPEGINTFLTAMRDANVPQSWISNKSYLTKMKNVASTPEQQLPQQQQRPLQQATWEEDADEESGYNTVLESFFTLRQRRQSTASRIRTWTPYSPKKL